MAAIPPSGAFKEWALRAGMAGFRFEETDHAQGPRQRLSRRGGPRDPRGRRGIEVVNKPGLSPSDLLEAITDVDGLVIRSGTKVTADVIAAAEKLRVIGRAGIGVDNVDVPAATARGIVVVNTPEGNNVTTAEHAIALLVSLARHIPQATASMKAGKWEKKKFEGMELFNRTLGVVGLGNIGRIVAAARAAGSACACIAYDPYIVGRGGPAPRRRAASPSTSCSRAPTPSPCTCRAPRRRPVCSAARPSPRPCAPAC